MDPTKAGIVFPRYFLHDALPDFPLNSVRLLHIRLLRISEVNGGTNGPDFPSSRIFFQKKSHFFEKSFGAQMALFSPVFGAEKCYRFTCTVLHHFNKIILFLFF